MYPLSNFDKSISPIGEVHEWILKNPCNILQQIYLRKIHLTTLTNPTISAKFNKRTDSVSDKVTWWSDLGPMIRRVCPPSLDVYLFFLIKVWLQNANSYGHIILSPLCLLHAFPQLWPFNLCQQTLCGNKIWLRWWEQLLFWKQNTLAQTNSQHLLFPS